MYLTTLTLYLLPASALLFLFSSHPITMAIIIMFLTLVLCLMTGIIISSFLISYLLCLIYLGAMLILFVYISSLAPNEPFLSCSLKRFISLTLILVTMPPVTTSHIRTPMNFSNYLLLNKLFSYSMFPLTIMLMAFLLITLLSVASLLKLNNMPLKMFN